MSQEPFRILVVNLNEGKSEVVRYGDPAELLGGSGLAAGLYAAYGFPDAPADDPRQPMIFAIGPLTGHFPLMSKTVLGFKSPYHEQYAESHAGGRLALALRFAGYDALVITGAAPKPSCLIVGGRSMAIEDVHYLWGQDVLVSGKWLRRLHRSGAGHRSILRIGPAGERRSPMAEINVDTYRHFGRLGGGAVMGSKNLKGIIVLGDGSVDLPKNKDYPLLYRDIYLEMTQSPMMKKYHDLGTPENMLPLNKLHAVPWRNLQATHDEGAKDISGERFADELLLRKTACAGCPVGCIHVGLLREKFATEHEYLYRQVSYDHEPIFAAGSMIGITEPGSVLMLLEEMERQGLDVMSAGVALAWATEATEKGLISEKETLVPLAFGDREGYRQAARHLGRGTNEFYRFLSRGTEAAVKQYGGADFACVLGQEMAGYATGEVFFVSQAFGFRHSHLDSAGYSFDQKSQEKDVTAAVKFLLEEEKRRVQLTCMVSCLFARNVYTEERLRQALSSIGKEDLAAKLPELAGTVQAKRWALKFRTGYDPAEIRIPARFTEIRTWKGAIDVEYLRDLSQAYQKAIRNLVPTDSDPLPTEGMA